MDLTKYLGQETAEETSSPKLSKEEYAAMKKQEREEVWGMIDGKAKEVFRDGESLKAFLDFMARCKPQRTDNLFLLYAQNPEIQQVKTFDKWKEENRVVKSGSKGYYFIVGQEYEKDGSMQQGYSIQRAYDISQMRMKQPEEPERKSMDELLGALLTDNEVRIQIAGNLPDKVQDVYVEASDENMQRSVNADDDKWVKYVAQPGDTLFDVFEKSDCDIEEFLNKNGLKGIYILPGLVYFVKEK